MKNTKSKSILTIVLVAVTLIVLGYVFRIDRFGMAQISWGDFVKLNNVTYNGGPREKTKVEASLIDKQIGEVKFNIIENVNNPRYYIRNGDATFLPVGTEIYSLKSGNDAVAVKINNEYFLYQRYRTELMSTANKTHHFIYTYY